MEVILKRDIEEFFVTMLDSYTCPYTAYLSMPNNNGFTYCIKEIIHTLRNNMKNNLNNNYSKQLISNFYKYMQNDIVFREVDKIQYGKLMLNLKQYSEGDKISKKEQFTYFEHLYRTCSFSYREKLYNMIVCSYNNPRNELDYYDRIFNCFISELLAWGNSYKYLGYILGKYKNKKFSSFLKFIEYLTFANQDSFDIYLPLTNVIATNIEYLENNGQQIEKINERYYCKVYCNKCIDFYFVIKQNSTRIEAMFNMLRLYCRSNIDFDIEEDIIVQSQYFDEQESVRFSEIIRYKGVTPYYKHLDNTLKSLEKLKDLDRVLYHKILNIISYAEKDKDICNQSSYIDNWIALETLCSLSGRKSGYDSVECVLPSILTSKLITSYLTDMLKKSYKGKNKLILETFIEQSNNGKVNLEPINNVYYRHVVKKYSEILCDVKKLKCLFEKTENQICLDILRIYMLRNEYVHESNIHAFISMQQIKLKNLLSIVLDEFFKTLNRRIDSEYSELGLAYEIFTQLLNRCQTRETAFKLLLDKNCKIGNNTFINITLEDAKIEKHEFIFNVLKGNLSLLKKYVPASEY